MKKWIIFFSGFALAISIAFSSYLYLYRAEFTSEALSSIYKTPVKVDRIRVTSSDLELQNITVYNPTAYAAQPALQIAKVKIKIPIYNTLFALLDITPFSIRKVSVIDPTITVETHDGKTNWQELLQNILEAPKSTRHYYVETLIIEDLAVEIRNKEQHKHTKRLKPISTITLTYDDDSAPLPPSQLLYWATKHALSQIPDLPLPNQESNPSPFTPN